MRATLQREDYRLFFATAIVVGITVGFSLGTALVVGLVTGTWTQAWLVYAQVHGHAQLWGWIIFGSLGVLFQVLPRLSSAALPSSRTVLTTYGLLLAALFARSLGQPLATEPVLGALYFAAGPLELLGVTVAIVALESLRRRNVEIPGHLDHYLPPALGWLWVATLLEAVATVGSAVSGAALASNPWHEAALAAMIWGYVIMLIGGVSLRSFPQLLSLPEPRARPATVTLVALNLGVALTTAAPLTLMLPVESLSPLLSLLGAVVLAVAAGALTHSLYLSPLDQLRRPFPPGTGVFGAYIRTAYLWLLVAVAIALVEAVRALAGAATGYFELSGARHALTIGFIAMMLFGMASRMLPLFGGFPWFSPRLHWVSFSLLNVSVLLRTVFQPTFGYPGAGALLAEGAVLGLLSFVGLAVNVMLTLLKREQLRQRPRAITAETIVGDLITLYPATVEVFLAHGLKPVGQRGFQDRRARITSIGQLTYECGVALAPLLADLRRRVAEAGGVR